MRTFCYEYYNLELYQAYILLRRYNAWRVYGLVSTLHMRLKIVCRPTAREALFLINHIYIPFIFIMHANIFTKCMLIWPLHIQSLFSLISLTS